MIASTWKSGTSICSLICVKCPPLKLQKLSKVQRQLVKDDFVFRNKLLLTWTRLGDMEDGGVDTAFIDWRQQKMGQMAGFPPRLVSLLFDWYKQRVIRRKLKTDSYSTGPTLFGLRCILSHNFWTNYDLDLFSTSKWPSEPQFCERYNGSCQKND